MAECADNMKRLQSCSDTVSQATDHVIAALTAGRSILFCGNGGSASDAQHMAAELSGRFLKDRKGLPGIALTANAPALTAIGNDYAFEDIFSRQVEGLGRAGDVLIGLSTSGKSPNVLKALKIAKQLKLTVIGLTGADGGDMPPLCDVCIKVPSQSTPRIQEMHLLVGHIICELAENALA